MYMYVDIDRLTEELDIEIPLFQLSPHELGYPQALTSIPDTAQNEKNLQLPPTGHFSFSLSEVLPVHTLYR